MANYKYIVDILAKNGQFVQAMNQNIQKTAELDKKVAAANKTTGNMMDGIGKLAGSLGIAFSVGAVVAWGKASVEAYNNSIQAETALLTALKGRTDVQQHLIGQATELMGKTLFDDDDIVRAQSLVAAFVKEESQIKRLIPTIMDYASAKQMDLASATDMVTRTMNGEMDAIGRTGIKVHGAAGSAERLTSIIQGLNNAYGGQAEAAAKVGTGALTILGHEYVNLMESVGKLLIIQQNQADSFTKKLTENIKSVSDFASKMSELNSVGSDTTNSFLTMMMVRLGIISQKTVDARIELGKLKSANDADVESTAPIPPETVDTTKIYANTLDGLNEKLKDYNEELKLINPSDKSSLMLKLSQIAAVEKQVEVVDKLKAAIKSMASDPASFRTDKLGSMSPVGLNAQVKGSDDAGKQNNKLANMNDMLARNKEIVDSLATSWSSFGDKYAEVLDRMSQGGEAINVMHIAGASFINDMMGFAESGADSMSEFADAARSAAMKVIDTYIAEGVAGSISGALKFLPFPLNMAAGALAAAGATTLFNSLIPKFETGGIVPGSSMFGDKMLIRANSGEEVLTRNDPRHRMNGQSGSMGGAGSSAIILQPSIEYGFDTFRIRLNRVEKNVYKRT